jgi:hypothetical protein
MAATAAASEITEAVIISGSRKGEIIRLNDIDWAALNDGLDSLNEKLRRVSKEIRATAKAFKTK